MRTNSITWLASAAALALLTAPAPAQDDAPTPPDEAPDAAPTPASDVTEASPLDELVDALTGGKVDFNLRLRYEFVDQDGVDDANAVTNRIRLGYTTAPFCELTFHIDVEDNRSFDDDRYNAAGLNDNPGKAVVADPEDTELNQLWANYRWTDLGTDIKVGRQRIKLDDDRFIGNVGWRQLEQTFDAVRVSSDCPAGITFNYAFIWDVNRIFGPDAKRDFDSESHAINLAWDGCPFGRLVGFAYLLDLENDRAVPSGAFFSSDTYGIRFEGNHVFNEKYSLAYIFSYASQSDAADNPTDYDADYYLAEGALTVADLATFGIGYEVLGSDDSVASFQTPLATGHKFNGWADLFLVTPPQGLEDFYIFARAPLPWSLNGAIYAHWFEAEDGGDDFGEEIDAIVSRRITSNWSVLAKFAAFNGKSGFPDTTRFWLQTEFTF